MLVLSCSICSVTAWPAAYFRVHNFFHFLIFECKVQIFHLQCTWNHFKSSQLLLLSYSWCSTLKSIGLCVFLKAPKIGSALPPACLQSASPLSLHPLELPGVCAARLKEFLCLEKYFWCSYFEKLLIVIRENTSDYFCLEGCWGNTSNLESSHKFGHFGDCWAKKCGNLEISVLLAKGDETKEHLLLHGLSGWILLQTVATQGQIFLCNCFCFWTWPNPAKAEVSKREYNWGRKGRKW